MAVRPHHDPSAYFCSHFLSVFTSSRPLFDAISFAPQVPIKPLLNDVGSQQPTGPFCLCLAFRWHTYLGRSVRAQGAHPALGCHLFMSIEKEMSNLGLLYSLDRSVPYPSFCDHMFKGQHSSRTRPRLKPTPTVQICLFAHHHMTRTLDSDIDLDTWRDWDSPTLLMRLEDLLIAELEIIGSQDEGLAREFTQEVLELDEELGSLGVHYYCNDEEAQMPSLHPESAAFGEQLNAEAIADSSSPPLHATTPRSSSPQTLSVHASSLPLPTNQHTSPPPTTTNPSMHSSRSPHSSRSSGTVESSSDMDLRADEEDLYSRSSRLRMEVINLRLKLEPQRVRKASLAWSHDEMEESTLKDLRIAVGHSSPETGTITLDQDLVLAIVKQRSEWRDEIGPLNEQIREHELNLYRTEYQLGQVEAQLHDLYHQNRPPSADLREGFERRRDSGTVFPHSPTSATEIGNIGHEDDGWPSNDEFAELPEYDPSSLHPKYVEWQKQFVAVQHVQEMLHYFVRQEAKLRDRKEQREGTELHLSKHESITLHLSEEDEEELVRLTLKVAESEAELREGLEVLAGLREECIEAGIDEREVRAGLLSEEDEEDEDHEVEDEEYADGDEAEFKDNERQEAEFEEWIITPAGDNAEEGSPKGGRWLCPLIHREELSPEAVSQEIDKLDNTISLTQSLVTLGPEQLHQVEAIRAEKNLLERDKRFEWAIAQVDRSSIRVFLKRVPRQLSPTTGQGISYTTHWQQDQAHEHNDEDVVAQLGDGIYGVSSYGPAHGTVEGEGDSSAISGDISNQSANPQHKAGAIVDHSLVNAWLFHVLAASILEVRLLAAILETTGVPLCDNTAQDIMEVWNTDLNIAMVDLLSPTNVMTSWKKIIDDLLRQGGYDKALPEQMLKADWESGAATRRRYSSSRGATSGYNS